MVRMPELHKGRASRPPACGRGMYVTCKGTTERERAQVNVSLPCNTLPGPTFLPGLLPQASVVLVRLRPATVQSWTDIQRAEASV